MIFEKNANDVCLKKKSLTGEKGKSTGDCLNMNGLANPPGGEAFISKDKMQ